MDELLYPSGAVLGSKKNDDTKRVQEWLGLQKCGTGIDGEFGPATQAAVEKFQRIARLIPSGAVDERTWAALCKPMMLATAHSAGYQSFGQAIVATAKAHLSADAREVGGDNRGPWVRLYCKGQDGAAFQWCQGFASSMYEQAQATGPWTLPFPLYDGSTFSLYVPWVVQSARKAGQFVASAEANADNVQPGSMFFCKDGSSYYHVGIVTAMEGGVFHTIEGNTNDDGSPAGYEVCARVRSKVSCDFGVV